MRQIRISSRPVVASALVALLVSALVPAVAGAHTPSVPIKFSVSIGDGCIYGTASDGASVTLSLKSAQGRLKERATVEAASESGYFEYCSSDGDVVEIGDRIRANDGTSARLLVVPDLSLVINRVDDSFKGRAPAGDYVRLICHYGWEPCGLSWRIKVNSQGMWGYKPQGFGVTGWQRMSLNWKSDAGDLVAISARGPHVDVTIGSAVVRGSTRANAIATVVLRRAGSNNVAATAVTRAGPDGLFQAKFRNQSGKLVKVRVGDRITSDVSSDVNLIVPNVTLNVDAESGAGYGHMYRRYGHHHGPGDPVRLLGWEHHIPTGRPRVIRNQLGPGTRPRRNRHRHMFLGGRRRSGWSAGDRPVAHRPYQSGTGLGIVPGPVFVCVTCVVDVHLLIYNAMEVRALPLAVADSRRNRDDAALSDHISVDSRGEPSSR